MRAPSKRCVNFCGLCWSPSGGEPLGRVSARQGRNSCSKWVRTSFSNCDHSKHCEFCGQFIGSLAPAITKRISTDLSVENFNMRLILASASIGRKKLLSYLKIPFEVIPSTIDEKKIIATSPLATLKLRAKLKTQDVCQKLIAQKQSNDSKKTPIIVLSADSGVIIDGKLIGKPKNYQEALRILTTLSGRTHKFATAVYLSYLKKDLSVIKSTDFYAVSRVTFRRLSKEDIKRYLSIIDYTRYAGGYAIASAQDFITKVEGSISNVIGLPLEKVLPIFRREMISNPSPIPSR